MDKKIKNWVNIGWASSLGLTMVFSIVIGLVIGIWLDKFFNTKPYLTISFIILGIISGFYTVIKEGIKNTKKKE